MSLTQLTFEITGYYPSTYNFNGYSFHIISDETKFNGIIIYEARNTVNNRIDVKTDVNYFIKAMYAGELVGIANFKVPSSSFYKKAKCLTFPKLRLTMSEYTKKKLFANQKEKVLSVDLKITFSYIEKHIIFKTNKKEDTNVNHKSNYNTIQSERRRSPKVSSNAVLRNYKKPFQLTTPKPNKVKSAHHSANTSLDLSRSSDSEISIIDSVLIDNEYNNLESERERVNEEKELEKLRTELTEESILPIDSMLPEKINKQKEKMIIMQVAYQRKIESLVDTHEKLVESFKNYNDKLRTLKKKIHKLDDNKQKYQIENTITTKINRNSDNYVQSLVELKQKENNLLKLIMKNYDKSNTQKSNEKDKQLLLSVMKKVLELKVDLQSCFNKEGITKFKSICEKYNLIDTIINSSIPEESLDNSKDA